VGFVERPEPNLAAVNFDIGASTQGSRFFVADAQAPAWWDGWRANLTITTARANRLGDGPRRRSHVEARLSETRGPVVAATDYVRAFAEQIRPYVPRRYVVLGTDGFGRSDTREKLRRFFEVDRHHVAVAALQALAEEGALPEARVSDAISKYGIDRARPPPWTV